MNLNAAQLAAVTHRAGPLQIIAGPGSGKTRTLTHRIAWLIDQGVPPSEILALTFTRKAAAEMRERIATLVSEDASSGIRATTIHSLCLHLLRQDGWKGELIHGGRQFLAWKKATEHTKVHPAHAMRVVSLAKNNGISRRWFATKARLDLTSTDIAKAWRAYEQANEREGLKDFDDLLVGAFDLLKDPELAASIRQHWPWVLVDEVQDIAGIQWEIVRQLAPKGANLTVVGDAAQSIYAFRGASPEDLEAFAAKWNADTVTLARNYRCSGAILAASERLIDHNGIARDLYTDNPEGEPVAFREFLDASEEATAIADHLEGKPPNDCAILVRTWAQTRAIEQALLKARIPYRVLDGIGFFGRAEVRDAIAYLSLAVDPSNDEALERILNRPNRYLGQAARQTLTARARALGVPLADALTRTDWPKDYMARSANSLDRVLRVLRAEAPHRSSTAMLREILTLTGYWKWLREQDDSEDRIDNLAELLEAAAEHPDPADFVFYARQLASPKSFPDAVTLSSIHGAKGREWSHVVVAGCAQGVLPHERTESIPEERRLAYVAMTRAKETLLCTTARVYRGRDFEVSQFVHEALASEEAKEG